jgi:indolepyruvate ferredoxin oxidoreductase, beta subunit
MGPCPFPPPAATELVEQARIEAWLESAVNAARTDYPLGVEVLKLQRLVKGYGDTHARGWRSFGTIMSLLPRLQGAPDAASQVAALHEAALQDDEGLELGRAIRTIERRTGATLAAPMEIVI